jgi:hypothetical protein
MRPVYDLPSPHSKLNIWLSSISIRVLLSKLSRPSYRPFFLLKRTVIGCQSPFGRTSTDNIRPCRNRNSPSSSFRSAPLVLLTQQYFPNPPRCHEQVNSPSTVARIGPTLTSRYRLRFFVSGTVHSVMADFRFLEELGWLIWIFWAGLNQSEFFWVIQYERSNPISPPVRGGY